MKNIYELNVFDKDSLVKIDHLGDDFGGKVS